MKHILITIILCLSSLNAADKPNFIFILVDDMRWFGTPVRMSGSIKALFQRCIGMTRNATCLVMTNLVYNMRRFEQIQRLNLYTLA